MKADIIKDIGDSAYELEVGLLPEEEDDDIVELDSEKFAMMDPICYPLQFHNLNIRLGKNVRDAAGNLVNKARGAREAFRCMIAGNQNIGKTTFACNLMGNIKYTADMMNKKNNLPSRSIIHICSTEGGMDVSEIIKNTGVSNQAMNNGELVFHDVAKMTTEYFVDLIKKIHEEKTANKENYKHIHNIIVGNMKTSLTPTIILLDSISMLFPEALKGKPVTNMIAAQQNKDNGYYMELINPLLMEANIMIFFVMHISKNISTNAFENPQRVYQNIKADINISGGKKVQYICDCGFFLNKIVSHDDRNANVRVELGVDDEYLMNAIEVNFFKNRCGGSTARNNFNLVSDITMGFSPIHSLVYEMISLPNIQFQKVGNRMTVDGYSGKPFYKKELYERITTDNELKSLLIGKYEEVFEYLLEAHNKSKERHQAARDFFEDLCA